MNIIDEMALTIQLADAEIFPTVNLKQSDYCKRIAQAAWDVMEKRLLSDDNIMRICKHPLSAAMTKARIKAALQAAKGEI